MFNFTKTLYVVAFAALLVSGCGQNASNSGFQLAPQGLDFDENQQENTNNGVEAAASELAIQNQANNPSIITQTLPNGTVQGAVWPRTVSTQQEVLTLVRSGQISWAPIEQVVSVYAGSGLTLQRVNRYNAASYSLPTTVVRQTFPVSTGCQTVNVFGQVVQCNNGVTTWGDINRVVRRSMRASQFSPFGQSWTYVNVVTRPVEVIFDSLLVYQSTSFYQPLYQQCGGALVVNGQCAQLAIPTINASFQFQAGCVNPANSGIVQVWY